MKKINIILVFLICFLALKPSLSQELLIIANKSLPVDYVSKRDIKLIYLKKKLFIKYVRVIPVNLHPFNPLRDIFNKYVLGMDEEQLALYWNEMYLRGIDPPIVLKSQKAVVRFVSKVEGAIGYITPKYLNNTVKVILRIKIDEN
ncbi:MAG: hypothetical protein GXO22_02880 [Aquificae bacterium]|nr:hypothetical protein [Aquificota bacterium]